MTGPIQWGKIFIFKENILCISSSKTEGEKVKTEETSKKCKIVLRFEIHKRINRKTHADITIAEKILYTLFYYTQLDIGDTH